MIFNVYGMYIIINTPKKVLLFVYRLDCFVYTPIWGTVLVIAIIKNKELF